jgi:uncharacterized lipoprotein YajG
MNAAERIALFLVVVGLLSTMFLAGCAAPRHCQADEWLVQGDCR